MDEKIPVSGKMLLLKAQEFAREIGYDNSEKLDINWVNRWKAREDIGCKKFREEAEPVDQDVGDKWQNHRLPTLLKELQPTKQLLRQTRNSISEVKNKNCLKKGQFYSVTA